MMRGAPGRGLPGGMAGALLLESSAGAEMQDFLAQPVRVIIPSSPGGSPDILTPLLTDRMARDTGKQSIVDYRPGGGTAVASFFVAKQLAGSYTLHHTSPSFTVSPAFNRQFANTIDIRTAFDPVTLAAPAPVLLVVNPQVSVRTAAELVAWVRANPCVANYAANSGTTPYLLIEQHRQPLGLDMVGVTFGGEAEGLQAVASGRTHLMVAIIRPARPLYESGTVQVLATIGSRRHPALRQVPTIPKSGRRRASSRPTSSSAMSRRPERRPRRSAGSSARSSMRCAIHLAALRRTLYRPRPDQDLILRSTTAMNAQPSARSSAGCQRIGALSRASRPKMWLASSCLAAGRLSRSGGRDRRSKAPKDAPSGACEEKAKWHMKLN